jgi:hypothetical protein
MTISARLSISDQFQPEAELYRFKDNWISLLIKRTRFDHAFNVSSVHKLLHPIVFITALRQAALGDRSAGSQQQRGSAPIHSPRHGICFEYPSFTGNVPPKLTRADHWGMPRPQPTIAGLQTSPLSFGGKAKALPPNTFNPNIS